MKKTTCCRFAILSVAALLITGCFLSFASGRFAAATENGSASKPISEEDFVYETIIVETDKPEALEEYGDVTKLSDELYIVETESKEAAAEAAENLDQKESVKKVLPDFEIKEQDITYDGMYSWGVAATGMDHYTDWLNLVAENGGDVRDIVVAVIDSGVDGVPEVFTDKNGNSRICSGEVANYEHDYINGDNDATDDKGHGTGVAGIIAESTPSNVCILPMKVLDQNGNGRMSDAMLAVLDAAPVADVMNMSLGMRNSLVDDESFSTIESFFSDVIGHYGNTIVAAAGNNAEGEAMHPASSAYTIAVSALKRNGLGGYVFDSSYSNYGDAIDFAMPGTYVNVPSLSTLPICAESDDPIFCYNQTSGTSFSAPHLSAAAALLRMDPEFNYTGTTNFTSANDVYTGLLKYTNYLGSSATGWDNKNGHGMVNFEDTMFASARVSLSATEVESGKYRLSGYALGTRELTQYAFTKSAATPTNWINTSSEQRGRSSIENKSYVLNNLSATFSGEGTYYLWVKDVNDNITKTKVTTPGADPSVEETQLVANGIYTIHASKDTSKVLDISGGSESNGANLQIYSENNSIAQKFIIRHIGDNIYEVENLKSVKELDVAGGGTGDGTNVWQYGSNSSCAQRWRIEEAGDGNYSFVSTCSGKYLDVAGGGTSSGTNVQIYTGNGTSSQRFGLSEVALAPSSQQLVLNDNYVIQSALNTLKVLDISGGSFDNGANLQIYSRNNTPAQTFKLTYLKDGFYRIESIRSNKALDVAGAGTENGTNVWQYASNDSIAQQWMLVKNSDNTYSLISRCNGLFLDIAGGSSTNGTNVQIYRGNNTTAQKFMLSRV